MYNVLEGKGQQQTPNKIWLKRNICEYVYIYRERERTYKNLT